MKGINIGHLQHNEFETESEDFAASLVQFYYFAMSCILAQRTISSKKKKYVCCTGFQNLMIRYLFKFCVSKKENKTYVWAWDGSSPSVTVSPWMSLKHFWQKVYLLEPSPYPFRLVFAQQHVSATHTRHTWHTKPGVKYAVAVWRKDMGKDKITLLKIMKKRRNVMVKFNTFKCLIKMLSWMLIL